MRMQLSCKFYYTNSRGETEPLGGNTPAGPYADKLLPYDVFLAASDKLGSDHKA